MPAGLGLVPAGSSSGFTASKARRAVSGSSDGYTTFDGYAGTRSRSSGCAYVCHPRVPSPTAMMAVVAHE